MRRIRELVGDIRTHYPEDGFFSFFENTRRDYPRLWKTVLAYDRALMALDDTSWQILKNKALQHYLDHPRPGQKKQGFFNQLNEAFAYRYLINQGFTDVRFIEEEKNKSPDIRFMVHNTQAYCEVKTLGISDKEIDRRNRMTVFDPMEVYVKLSDGFLNKFSDAIDSAWRQINTKGAKGLVYILVLFDDSIRLDFYNDYRKHLICFCRIHGFENLFIKIGLEGNKRIDITHRSI